MRLPELHGCAACSTDALQENLTCYAGFHNIYPRETYNPVYEIITCDQDSNACVDIMTYTEGFKDYISIEKKCVWKAYLCSSCYKK